MPSILCGMSATLLSMSRVQFLLARVHGTSLLAPFFLSKARPFSWTPVPPTERSPHEFKEEFPIVRQAPLSILLKSFGLPQSCVHHILCKTPLLNAPHHSESVFHNICRLKEMGLGADALVSVLEEAPALLINSLNAVRGVEFLERMGFTKAEIDQICCLFPRSLVYHAESRLTPLFEEFDHFGFGAKAVRQVVVQEPALILGMEAGEMLRYYELLTSLKCRAPIKEKIFEKGPLCAILSVKRCADCLCRRGLIRREALGIIWREPRVLLYGIEDINKKIHYLLDTMRFNIDALVDVPRYLGVSLDKQIIPRYQVMERLRSMGALDFQVALFHIVKPSRRKFYNMFVKPYPECEQLFRSVERDVEMKRKHVPVGLWKLFNPSKYLESTEDVNSMKTFIESLV